mgnify:CR=1 FL=1
MKKEKYIAPELEIIDMMVEGDILAISGVDAPIYDDAANGTDALSTHRSGAFPWSEEE